MRLPWWLKVVLVRIHYARKLGIKYLFLSKKKIKNRITSLRSRKVYGGSWASNRSQRLRSVKRRDGSKCRWCKTRLKDNEVTLDHIVEKSKGGTNHVGNLQILCLPCHLLKNQLATKQVNLPFLALKNSKL